MNAKVGYTCALVLLGASMGFAQSGSRNGSGDAASVAKIQQIERDLSKAADAHDVAPFKKYIDEGIIARGPGWKATGKAELLQGIQSSPCTGHTDDMTDFSSRWISRDVLLVTYVLTGTQTCGGKSMPTREYTSSLWHRTGDNWTSMFHQATEVMPTGGAGAGR